MAPPAARTCPHCGAELDPPDAIVCIGCGFYLGQRPSGGPASGVPDASGSNSSDSQPDDHQ